MTKTLGLEKLSLGNLREVAASVSVPFGTKDKDTLVSEIIEALRKMRDAPPPGPDQSLASAAVAAAQRIPGARVGVLVDGKTVDPPRSLSPAPAPDIALDEIHWRIDSKPTNVDGNKGRARYISYIDRNVAAAYLDRWLGPDGWEDSYVEAELAGARVLWCHLRLHFPDRTVVRSDLSTFGSGRGGSAEERQATGLKGLVSDAFKRAASKAGVGRNVYRLPEVWAECRVTRDGKAYPTDRAMEQIAAELRKAGHEPTAVTVPETPGEDEPEPEPDWTRHAKNQIWSNLSRPTDLDVVEKWYRRGVEGTGIPDPIPTEDDAARVVAAATSLALAETLPAVPGGEPFTERPTEHERREESAVVDEDEPETWTRDVPNPTDPAWAYEIAARRATLKETGGDVASARSLFESMTAETQHPLSRDDYSTYVAALSAPVGAA